MKQKGQRKKRKAVQRRSVWLVFACILFVLGSALVFWMSKEEITEWENSAIVQTGLPVISASPKAIASDPPSPTIIAQLLTYYQQNPDTVGYIYIENTSVDYPVLYSGDNEFYLSHDFNKEASEAGAIFMDFRCDIEDFNKTRNIIIYGHRMKDGSMFKSLTNYQSKTFFYDNPIIAFDTLYQQLEWEVFAVFIAHTDFYYIDTYFPNDEKWMRFLAECQGRSMYETDVTLSPTDIVLTLSTCAAKENKRLVIMARLKR